MVELVEVEDESFETKQPGPEENEDDYYTDTDSSITDDEEDDEWNAIQSETLLDRIVALKDMVSPTTRTYISNTVSTTTSLVKSGLFFSGKTMFVLSTSTLFLGVPWVLSFIEEQQYAEMEKEMKMREQGSDLLNPNSAAAGAAALGQIGQTQSKPAL